MSYPPQPPNPYGPAAYPPPRKRRRGLLVGLLGVAVVFFLCAVGAAIVSQQGGKKDTQGPGAQGAATNAKGAADTKNDSGKTTIVMEITGAKRADVTYGLNADQSQDSNATVPWKKTLTSNETLTVATVLAQNKGSGTIKCKVTVNGKVVKENASTGEYAIVTCTAENL